MVKADFFKNSENKLLGFCISGHSDYAAMGDDVACASISSAVMLTANAMTDIFKLDAKVGVQENEIMLKLNGADDIGDKLLLSLLTQLYEIQHQYPSSVEITIYDR
ncbi:MAG: ribosomal-processing cysteine protease Prp [Ruminococcus sp.]|nr:ribosomal-processing cysteine protease Prp [Ruminococcus sp.]MCD7772526.1 ribosomal-processing cysteine protease Prp [Ruminococcus sp.]MCD8328118.1 ribosomal-processing cysteine protease Prp [Ruminococcus sp.]